MKYTQAFNYHDTDGNALSCNNDGVVTLHLPHEKRILGRLISTNGHPLFIRRAIERRHVFRRGPSWGMNGEAMKILAGLNGVVRIVSDKACYELTAREILQHGWLWFKRKGLERQIFVNLSHWRKHEG